MQHHRTQNAYRTQQMVLTYVVALRQHAVPRPHTARLYRRHLHAARRPSEPSGSPAGGTPSTHNTACRQLVVCRHAVPCPHAARLYACHNTTPARNTASACTQCLARSQHALTHNATRILHDRMQHAARMQHATITQDTGHLHTCSTPVRSMAPSAACFLYAQSTPSTDMHRACTLYGRPWQAR